MGLAAALAHRKKAGLMDAQPKKSDVLVTDNRAVSRFEARIGDDVAFAEYRRDGDTIFINHTEVPPSLERKGIGSALAHAALEQARAERIRVVPLCPFFAAYIKRHPEYADLVKRVW